MGLLGAAIEALLGREEWTLRLLDAVEKSAPVIAELFGPARLRLQLHGSEAVKLRLARVLPPIRADRTAVLVLDRGNEVLRGDLGRGEVVYRKICAACRALHGAETGQTLALALAGGASKAIPRTMIRILKGSPVSLMPEGF